MHCRKALSSPKCISFLETVRFLWAGKIGNTRRLNPTVPYFTQVLIRYWKDDFFYGDYASEKEKGEKEKYEWKGKKEIDRKYKKQAYHLCKTWMRQIVTLFQDVFLNPISSLGVRSRVLGVGGYNWKFYIYYENIKIYSWIYSKCRFQLLFLFLLIVHTHI